MCGQLMERLGTYSGPLKGFRFTGRIQGLLHKLSTEQSRSHAQALGLRNMRLQGMVGANSCPQTRGCGSKKGYVAVSRHPPMLHTYVAPTCFIRMSRGLSRLFHAVLKKRYETHAVPRRGLSQGLVAEACRGGLSRTACRKQNGFVTNPMSRKDAREPVTYLDF